MPEQQAKDCGRDHGLGKKDDENQKKVSDGELDEIVDRLYKTQTKCREESQNKDSENKKKEGKSDAEVDAIVERLYQTKTKAMEEDPSQRTVAEDQISKKVVSGSELDGIVDRLYTTHTASSSADNKPKNRNQNTIAGEPLSEEQIKAIYERLLTTHTKSSSGGVDCKPYDPMQTPGLGLKMLPIIEGLEERFRGKQLSEEQVGEIMQRLLSTDTSASKARKDFPRILLYPERTTLHNNFNRIKDYQNNGSMTRQKELERREKWFN